MDLTPVLSAGGIVGLFGVVAVLVVQLFRENGRLRDSRDTEIKDLKSDVGALKAENLACRWQVNGLVNVLREAGVAIPEWLFRRGDLDANDG